MFLMPGGAAFGWSPDGGRAPELLIKRGILKKVFKYCSEPFSPALSNYLGNASNPSLEACDFKKRVRTVLISPRRHLWEDINTFSGDRTGPGVASEGMGAGSFRPLILLLWWKTWDAWLSICFAAGVTVYLAMRFWKTREMLRKEKEQYQARIDFFTHVSHEIRTHLSLIRGPIEKAVQLTDADTDAGNYLTHAKHSSERLLHLVSELLDFRKIQSGKMALQVGEHDLIKMLKNVLASFEHVASEKRITTQLKCETDKVRLWCDLLQMQKVFYNLIGNAYKFTDDGGSVSVVIKRAQGEFVIEVTDNGRGIRPEQLKELFRNFSRVNEDGDPQAGYGIGLALSKAIVERHHGTLTVTSFPATKSTGRGATCFTVKLRTGNGHFPASELIPATPRRSYGDAAVAWEVAESTGEKQKKTILLIEDNDELRTFMVEAFSARYDLLEADNGHDGLMLARSRIPDLIVSDVRMPGFDGLHLCAQLKADMTTSHIPVIIVSAKNTAREVAEGLRAGADDYLVKPFDFEILELKIDNLIRIREALKRNYRHLVLKEPEEIGLYDADEAFIARLRNLVVENMSDAGFGVNEMAFHIGMSVSALYRKLRALTGLTVNLFIKEIRMKKALQLLESGAYHVNEVATIVGFDDNRYFSKEFKKAFGKLPNEVRRGAAGNS